MKPSKYDFKQLEHFRPSVAPRAKWLWKRFIPERAVTVIVGATGSYKSTFLLALCGAISKGEKFMGSKTRQRRVLYLDNENTSEVLRRRDFGLKLDLDSNENLRLWSINGKRAVPRIYQDHGRTLRQIVCQSYKEDKKPLLIVFDHWSTFLKPGDGGETTGQTSPVIQNLKRLCALGATVVVLAHTRKDDPERIYGGGDIKAKSAIWHVFVRRENSDRVQVRSDLRGYGKKRTFSIRAVESQNKDEARKEYGPTSVTGFAFADAAHENEPSKLILNMQALISKHPDYSQRQLRELSPKALKIGEAAAEALLRDGEGKYWVSEKAAANGKKTYRTLPMKKAENGD